MPFNPLHYPIALMRPRYLSDASAWIEHIPFAFVLMSMAKPRVFVELGTHKGDSYLAFCQAVKHLGLSTRCTAVDTWKGDAHAGYYDADVLGGVRAAHDPLYASFSRLLQTDFDSAVSTFEDGSIDLLYIDGLHTYEAVRHDYESWLPKLSPQGIVLFHNTAVMERGFGVHQFFGELAAAHPAFAFQHGFGLGIVAPGPSISPAVAEFLEAGRLPPEPLRNFFAALGQSVQLVKTISLVTGEAYRSQLVLNSARRHMRLPVDSNSDRPETAFANPLAYVAAQRASLESFLKALSQPRR